MIKETELNNITNITINNDNSNLKFICDLENPLTKKINKYEISIPKTLISGKLIEETKDVQIGLNDGTQQLHKKRDCKLQLNMDILVPAFIFTKDGVRVFNTEQKDYEATELVGYLDDTDGEQLGVHPVGDTGEELVIGKQQLQNLMSVNADADKGTSGVKITFGTDSDNLSKNVKNLISDVKQCEALNTLIKEEQKKIDRFQKELDKLKNK